MMLFLRLVSLVASRFFTQQEVRHPAQPDALEAVLRLRLALLRMEYILLREAVRLGSLSRYRRQNLP